MVLHLALVGESSLPLGTTTSNPRINLNTHLRQVFPTAEHEELVHSRIIDHKIIHRSDEQLYIRIGQAKDFRNITGTISR